MARLKSLAAFIQPWYIAMKDRNRQDEEQVRSSCDSDGGTTLLSSSLAQYGVSAAGSPGSLLKQHRGRIYVPVDLVGSPGQLPSALNPIP